MNSMLWMFAIVLALVFLITGVLHVFYYEAARKRMSWVEDVPRPLVLSVGVLEILGALGLVLPALIRGYAWLTPVAALGLAVLMLSISTFHILRRETDDASVYVLLLILAAFVGIGRLMLVPLS